MLPTTSEYEAFVDEVNDALSSVANSESIVFFGIFNSHVGIDNETWMGVIGRHLIAGANKKILRKIIRIEKNIYYSFVTAMSLA